MESQLDFISKKKMPISYLEDEVSFPQWGSLTYTWALRGQQPTVKHPAYGKAIKLWDL